MRNLARPRASVTSLQRLRRRAYRLEALEPRRLLTATADLDGDGDLDAYAANVWYENVDGRGNFFGYEVADRTILTAADMDSDGDLDLITSEPRWYENVPGANRFGASHAFPADALPASRLKVIDLGGDGDNDVIAFSDNVVSLYENVDGQGNFELSASTNVPGTTGADDIDGDGDLDLAVIRDEQPSSVYVLTNNGDGTFSEQLVVSATGYARFSDLNGDGAADLFGSELTADNPLGSPVTSIAWWSNTAGRFESPQIAGATAYGGNRMLDVNHDGALDYVAVNAMSLILSWTLNDGLGGFEQEERMFSFSPSIDWNPSDVNGDGITDVVTNDFRDGAPIWLDGETQTEHLNVVPPFGSLRAGDANRDFYFDEADLIQVAALGAFESGVADWESGDWTGAPGGTRDQPPIGDQRFDSEDLFAASIAATYLTGPYSSDATTPIDEAEALALSIVDADLTLEYTSATGDLNVINHRGPLTAFRIVSKSSIFDVSAPVGFNDLFDVRSPGSFFQFTPVGFEDVQLGTLLPSNLTWRSLQHDLRVDGARLGGGDLGRVQLTCVDCALNIDTYQQWMRDQVWNVEWDFTRDGRLGTDDLQFLVEELLKSSIGDSNLDGQFDSSDLVHVFDRGTYEDAIADNSRWIDGDWNGDGEFDSRDFVFALQSGRYADTPDPPAPEPTAEIAFVERDLQRGTAATSLAHGDLDGDGDEDIVIFGYRAQRIEWFENVRDGMFHRRRTIDEVGEGTGAVEVTDLDADGDLDVIVASWGFENANQIVWYENLDGAGTFSDATFVTNERGALTLAVADMDGDGDTDIVSGNFGRGVAWVENVNGDATNWSYQTLSPFGDVRSVHIGDIDLDGALDILAHTFDRTSWIRNAGGGTFESPRSVGSNFWSLDVGDVDGDGDLDIVGSDRERKLNWLENDGQGQFTGNTLVAEFARHDRVVLTDLDRDNDLDIATSSFQSSSILQNEGGGQFSAAGPITTGQTGSVFFLDVDNDDDQDVIVNVGSVYKNSGQAAFSHYDHFNAANGASPQSILTGDLDNDGDIDAVAANPSPTWLRNRYGTGDFPHGDVLPQAANAFATAPEQLIDLDGDGDQDILTISTIGGLIQWQENENGEGYFGRPQPILLDGERPVWARGADLDGDGDTDVAASFDGRLVWFENENGRGNFRRPIVIDNDRRARSGQLIDLDQDGDDDIVVENAWYENRGSGDFSKRRVIVDANVTNLQVSDVDRDGDLDFTYVSSAIYWVANDGFQAFDAPQQISEPIDVASFAVADLDRDGTQDFIASTWAGEVIWYRNQNANRFESTTLAANLGRVTSVEVTDLDSDGDLDVAATLFDEDLVVWFENQPKPA